LTDDKDLQRSVQRIAGLVRELEEISDPAARSTARQLIQVLLELHASVLERMLDKTFQRGEIGASLIDEFGGDGVVGGLLAFYGLHPLDLPTRVAACVEKLNARYRAQEISVDVERTYEGKVYLRVMASPHTCGSTSAAVRAEIEDAVYSAAPDLTSLQIAGPDGRQAAGFVSLDKLTQGQAATTAFTPVAASDGV